MATTLTETADPPQRYRALAVLATAMMLAMAPWFSAAAVIPQLRDQWHLSTDAASLLIIAVQVGFVAGAVISAALSLADVVAPRRLILWGTIGAAVANAGLVLVDGPVGAVPLRFLTGFFLAAVYPPALKAMSTWFRAGRGTALGVMVGALTLGSALPHLVNGSEQIVEVLDVEGLHWHMHAPQARGQIKLLLESQSQDQIRFLAYNGLKIQLPETANPWL